MDPQQQMIQALMAQQSPGSMGQMQSTGMGAPPWKNPTSSMQPMGDQMNQMMHSQGGMMGGQPPMPPAPSRWRSSPVALRNYRLI